MLNNYFYTLLLFLSVFISAISQVLLKKSAQIQHSSWLKEYLNVRVITAYSLYFVTILIDMIASKYVPLSFIPIIQTSSYVFVIVFSRIFFKESISLLKFIGMAIVILGIVIYVI